MHVLVAGWFSWDNMGVTAGDIIARDIVCNWLNDAAISFDVALHDSNGYPGAVNWQTCAPDRYTDIIFVCGPFGNGYPVTEMLNRFSGSRLTGIDLSLLDTLENWNPFALLFERDSSRTAHPDITFYAPPPTVPVVGLILAHKQKEYKERARHNEVEEIIAQLCATREMAIVTIDTALENNTGHLRTAAEIESLIARMDVVITTRLHGTVLALKNGVPVIPVDPISGGAKISTQVKTIGWPLLFNPEDSDSNALVAAFDYCLTKAARDKAQLCAGNAKKELDTIRTRFVSEFKALANIKTIKYG